MEFISIATFHNNEWRTMWLGPTNLLKKSKRTAIRNYRDDLLRQQDSHCNYCGDPIKLYPTANCDCDHIIPIKYGGTCEIDNLQLLCVCCHRYKSKEERRNQKSNIFIGRNTNDCVYLATKRGEYICTSGKIQPRDIVKVDEGLYEIGISPNVPTIFPLLKRKRFTNTETEMDRVDKTRKKLKEEEIRKLGMVDVRGMCQRDIGDLLKKIIKQTATEDDVLSYRKHQSQRFFTDNLTGEEVASFELNKRPIVNLILRTKVDTIFRDKLYMNYVDMGLDPEFGKTDLHVIKLLHDCLGEYSIKCIFDDTSLLDFSIDNPSVQDILKQIDSLSSCRCRAKSLKRRLSHYLERYLGVSVKKFMVWNPILKKSVPTFKLSICFSDWLEKKTILGTNKWIRQKFEEYDRFKKIPLGSEYKFNRARRTIVGFCNKYYDLKNKEPIVNPFAKFAYSPII